MSKTIDWTKPIRVGIYPATVVREDYGNRHIIWDTLGNGRADAFVDSHGNLIATLHDGCSKQAPFVENVPEEPKNCIVLIKAYDGSWFAHRDHHHRNIADAFYSFPVSRTEAETIRSMRTASHLTSVIVEVPVPK